MKLPKLCNHCIDAPCIKACPVAATLTVKGDIVVDEEKCIGGVAGVTVCPYDARYITYTN